MGRSVGVVSHIVILFGADCIAKPKPGAVELSDNNIRPVARADRFLTGLSCRKEHAGTCDRPVDEHRPSRRRRRYWLPAQHALRGHHTRLQMTGRVTIAMPATYRLMVYVPRGLRVSNGYIDQNSTKKARISAGLMPTRRRVSPPLTVNERD